MSDLAIVDTKNRRSMFVEFAKLTPAVGIYLGGMEGQNIYDECGKPPMSSLKQLAHNWISDNADTVSHSNSAIKVYDAKYDKLESTGITPQNIMAFDCSGLVCWALVKLGDVVSKNFRVRAVTLYTKCVPITQMSNLREGDLLFCGKTAQDITHVGIYVGDNTVIEASGHAYGVVATQSIAKSAHSGAWTFAGRYFVDSDEEIQHNKINDEVVNDQIDLNIGTIAQKLSTRAPLVFDEIRASNAISTYRSTGEITIDMKVAIMNFKMMNGSIDGCTSTEYDAVVSEINNLRNYQSNYLYAVFTPTTIVATAKQSISDVPSEALTEYTYLKGRVQTLLAALNKYGSISDAFREALFKGDTLIPEWAQRTLEDIYKTDVTILKGEQQTVESLCILTDGFSEQDSIANVGDFFATSTREMPVSYVQNLTTGWWTPIPVFQNNVSETVSATFTPTTIPGRTSQFYSYIGTSNRTWNLNLQMHIDVLENYGGMFAGDDPQTNLLKIISFLKSLQYPQYTQGRINPPLCIFKLGDVMGHLGKRGIFQNINVSEEIPISKLVQRNGRHAHVNTMYTVTGTFIEIPEKLLDEKDIRLEYKDMFG